MIRFLAPAGLLMLLVGLGAYYTTGEFSGFAVGNMIAGVITLVSSAGASARRFRGFSGAVARRVAWRWAARGSAVVVAVLLLNVVALDWGASLD